MTGVTLTSLYFIVGLLVTIHADWALESNGRESLSAVAFVMTVILWPFYLLFILALIATRLKDKEDK